MHAWPLRHIRYTEWLQLYECHSREVDHSNWSCTYICGCDQDLDKAEFAPSLQRSRCARAIANFQGVAVMCLIMFSCASAPVNAVKLKRSRGRATFWVVDSGRRCKYRINWSVRPLPLDLILNFTPDLQFS